MMIPCAAVIAHVVTSNLPEHVASTDGRLVSTAEAESLEDTAELESAEPVVEAELGPGKRKR